MMSTRPRKIIKIFATVAEIDDDVSVTAEDEYDVYKTVEDIQDLATVMEKITMFP